MFGKEYCQFLVRSIMTMMTIGHAHQGMLMRNSRIAPMNPKTTETRTMIPRIINIVPNTEPPLAIATQI